IAVIVATETAVMMPRSSPYSIRSWPDSSRTNRLTTVVMSMTPEYLTRISNLPAPNEEILYPRSGGGDDFSLQAHRGHQAERPSRSPSARPRFSLGVRQHGTG